MCEQKNRVRPRSPPTQSHKFPAVEHWSISFGYFKRWDRNHKLATPLADVRKLPNNFLPQIPRQNQNVIRPGRSDHIRMVNRDVSARKKMALLMWADIRGVIEEILADSAIVKERVAFGGSPVADHR